MEEEDGTKTPMLHPAEGGGHGVSTGNGHVPTQPPDDTSLKNDTDDEKVDADDPKRHHHLLFSLIKQTWRQLLMSCVLSIIVETCCFAQPFLILVIVRTDPPTQKTIRYVCAAGLIIYNFLQSSLRTLAQYLLERAVTKVRIFLMHAGYCKITSGDTPLLRDPDVTYVMFTMDVDRFCRILLYMEVVVGPVSLLATFTILIYFLEVAPLPALALTVVVIIVRTYCCLWEHALLTQALRWTTKRISLLKEAILKLEAIKILCLEDRFMSRFLKYSSREFSLTWRSVYISAFNHGLGRVAIRLSMYLTVVLLVILNPKATLHSCILVINYMRLLESNLFTRLPIGVAGAAHAWTHVKRFQDFLDGKEKEEPELQKAIPLDDLTETGNLGGFTPQSTHNRVLHKESDPSEVSVEPEVVNEEDTSWRGLWFFLSSWPGSLFVPFIFFFACATEVLGLLSEWWIIKCRTSHDGFNKTELDPLSLPGPPSLRDDLVAYTLLIAAHIMTELLLDGLSAHMLTSTLGRLHNKMIGSLLYSKFTNVKSLSLGSTLSAFSKDILCLSKTGFSSMYNIGTNYLRLFTQMLFVCILFPWVIIPTVPYAISLIVLRLYVEHKANQENGQGEQMKIDETSVSKRYCVYISQSEQRKGWFQHLALKSWLRLRINIITFVFSVCIILQIVFTYQNKERMGECALVLTVMITFLNYVEWSVGAYNKQIYSIQRLQEYTQLEAEVKDGLGAWCDWPASGRVTYRRVSLPSDHLQTPFDVVIPAGVKVGVLYSEVARGRSFLNTLLALEDHPGCVFLDGVNVSNVSAHLLRTAVTVVQPELVCSSGYLRDYLDPKQAHSDDSLWDTLDRVALKDKVKSLTSTLRLDLRLAAGQLDEVEQQLVGVARAVVHNSQVVVVWTENQYTDIRADYRVQDVIRQVLPEATRVRITPSVRGVISSDRVLVLGEEQVTEYPNPWRLLVYGESHYEQLVEEVGAEEAAHLRTLTREFYQETARMESIPEGDEDGQLSQGED